MNGFKIMEKWLNRIDYISVDILLIHYAVVDSPNVIYAHESQEPL